MIITHRITDSDIKKLKPPATSNRIQYDGEVKGLGIRVTVAGTKAFILNYRTAGGRERRFTIGAFPDWKVAAAREEAKRLKRRIDQGEDPLEDIQNERGAKTVADLCDRFIDEHLPKKRSGTQADYKRAITAYILPALKHRKVADVSYSDIDGLHRKITKNAGPYRANRVVAVCSKMFNLGVRWTWCAANPCKSIERNQETKRRRYLSAAELARLTVALADHRDQQAANVIRLLLLTGARKGETLCARWDDIDLETGTWTKPGATTKQKTEHAVPLSAPARQLLGGLREQAEAEAKKTRRPMGAFVFPGRYGAHRDSIKKNWAELCATAKLSNARMHDLRHTFASILVSGGSSLPLIGALLGHTQPATTARYSHLFDEPMRAATERVGAVLAGKPSAEIIPLKKR